MRSLAVVPRPVERLLPLERLEALCDPGTLRLQRTGIVSTRLGDRARPGDGVFTGTGRVGGRPIACYAQDVSLLGGSLGANHAESIVQILRLAGRARIPVIGFIESGGARLQEGLEALDGYGAIFLEHVALSGRVPQISVICGTSAGGGCYGPALTDFIVMTKESAMFLTGPGVVREVTGEDVTLDELGGPAVHEKTGVCHAVAPTEADAAILARELVSHLPDRAGGRPPSWRDPEDPLRRDPAAAVPLNGRKVYDMRDVVRTLVDRSAFLEMQPRWARNMLIGFARIDGRSVGIVANQPRYMGGILDAEGAQKAARFIRTCNLFGVPLLVLVDTPGFLPGTGQEKGAVIRHGAKLVHAFAEASVPSVTVVVRKAFGGAYIAMNSRQLGADLVLAWPGAELGVMGAPQAVGVIHRREMAASDDPERLRARLAEGYAAEHLTTAGAAADGHVDEVIAPETTRDRVAEAFAVLGQVEHDTATGIRGRNLPL